MEMAIEPRTQKLYRGAILAFIGRRPSLEDDLRWEDDPLWKTTYVEGRLLVEEDLLWKTTFGGRRHLVKTTFGGR